MIEILAIVWLYLAGSFVAFKIGSSKGWFDAMLCMDQQLKKVSEGKSTLIRTWKNKNAAIKAEFKNE